MQNFTIETAKDGKEYAFWIGKVGSNAGKPYREMSYKHASNMFGVICDESEKEMHFHRVNTAFSMKAFYPYLHGSCQPFIRKKDVLNVIENVPAIDDASIKTLNHIDKHLEILEAQLNKYNELRLALQRNTFLKGKVK